LKRRKEKSNTYSFLLFSFHEDAPAYYNYKSRKPNRNLAIKVEHNHEEPNRLLYNKRRRTTYLSWISHNDQTNLVKIASFTISFLVFESE